MFWFEPPDQHLGWTYKVPGALDNNFISNIENYSIANPTKLRPAEILNDKLGLETAYRRTDIMWLDDMNSFPDLYKQIIDIAMTVNNQYFKYNLCYIEPLQYSVYKEDNLGNYDIHCDSNLRNTSGFNRKISFSIMLNDPSEFEGGELKFHYLKDPVVAELNKGDMILFPSFIPHSVAPVTKGVRRSLVGWVCGMNDGNKIMSPLFNSATTGSFK